MTSLEQFLDNQVMRTNYSSSKYEKSFLSQAILHYDLRLLVTQDVITRN